MREILFRGKRVDDGEWVYGYYIRKYDPLLPGIDINVIVTFDENSMSVWNKVAPETVGQYTGIQAKNGEKIFDGDIVSAPYLRGQKVEMMKGLIEFSKGAFSVVWQNSMYGKHFAGYVADMEVIGNIFDNLELWEENQ